MKTEWELHRPPDPMELKVQKHLQTLYLESGGQLVPSDQQRALAQLLSRYKDCFSQGEHDYGRLTHVV